MTEEHATILSQRPVLDDGGAYVSGLRRIPISADSVLVFRSQLGPTAVTALLLAPITTIIA